MKKLLFISLLFATLSISSQKNYTKLFAFKIDNDLFSSSEKDRYYTNGIYLDYKYLVKNKNEKVLKKTHKFQIGHQMYTPHRALVEHISLHDRPFAAYLFGNFEIEHIYTSNNILKTSIEAGIIGPAAYGKEIQNFIHSMYSYREAIGWKHQIRNSLGLNFNASFIKPLAKDSSNRYDLNWINNGKIGTVFTNLSSGIYTRIGLRKLQETSNTVAFNTNINYKKSTNFNQQETFIFLYPSIRYSLYDATIQGSFLNPINDVTKELTAFQFQLQVGIKHTVNRFNLGYTFYYHTNKSKDLYYLNGNTYAAINLSYLLL